MGRVNRVAKQRVIKLPVSDGNGGTTMQEVVETYWDTEYVTGPESYGADFTVGGE